MEEIKQSLREVRRHETLMDLDQQTMLFFLGQGEEQSENDSGPGLHREGAGVEGAV